MVKNKNLAYLENVRVRIDIEDISIHNIPIKEFERIAKITGSEVINAFPDKAYTFRYFTYRNVTFFT